MDGMVSVVPAILIVDIVDAIENAAEMAFGIISVNKGVLGPVAHHHDKSRIDDRNNKDHQRRFKIDKRQTDADEIK